MVVSDFDPLAYVAWIKGRPVAGSGLLANFLHEWTHRWCFDSRVGSALALLRMRAAARSLLGRSAMDDHVRCMTATTLLEPLAEGLALFAEFDAYPGESDWLSQTLTAATFYFTPAVETSGRPLIPLQGLLQTLRRDPALLERKAGIYAKRASTTDPYLLGYLSVKSLWCQLAANCRALNDRDLFLSYLRSYIYDDPGLVVAMLEPVHDEMRAAERIANHVLSRTRDLLTFGDLSERVERWILSAQDGNVDVTSIGATLAEKRNAESCFTKAMVADIDDAQSESLGAWIYMNLEERRICLIGSAKVEVRPSALSGHVDLMTPDGQVVHQAVKLRTSASGEGELILVGTSAGRGMIVFLHLEQHVQLVSSFGEYDDAELSLAERHVINREINESLHDQMRASLASSGAVELVWTIIESRVASAMNGIYGPLCTLNASEQDWPRAFEALQKGGLFGLLGGNGELTRALAAIGLINTWSTNLEVIRAFGDVLDVDGAALDDAVRVPPQHGLPLVLARGRDVVALV